MALNERPSFLLCNTTSQKEHQLSNKKDRISEALSCKLRDWFSVPSPSYLWYHDHLRKALYASGRVGLSSLTFDTKTRWQPLKVPSDPSTGFRSHLLTLVGQRWIYSGFCRFRWISLKSKTCSRPPGFPSAILTCLPFVLGDGRPPLDLLRRSSRHRWCCWHSHWHSEDLGTKENANCHAFHTP